MQVLLGLVKSFERILYQALRRESDRLGYPLRLFRLAVALYKMPRVVRGGEAVSDLVCATRCIVAGPGDFRLDHPCTQIGQHQGGIRAGQNPA